MNDNEVKLRKFVFENIEKTFYWVNSKDFKDTFLVRGEITEEGNYNYFSRILNDQSQVVFAIFEEEEHIGNCGLKYINSENGTAELWMYIGEQELRGKSRGGKAIHILLDYGFTVLNLETIYLHVAESNAVAIKFYLKNGFKELSINDISTEWIERGTLVKRMEINRKKYFED